MSTKHPTPDPDKEKHGKLGEDPNVVQGGLRPESERVDPKDQSKSKPPIEPVQTLGKPAYDRSSQRVTEIFDSSDVVFVREGATTHLTAYPKHEAETRFVEITKQESNFRAGDGKTITALELKGGDKVSIDGTTVIVTPTDGPATVETPDLNAKAPNEAH